MSNTTNRRSPAPGPLLPMPGSPSSSWAAYRARLAHLARHPDSAVALAFFLFGLINNVLYVIILSAAQDLLAGSDLPKAAVLLADVLPSFFTKLVAPYFIHRVPYWCRVLALVFVSAAGMFIIALAPPGGSSVPAKMLGIVLASFSSGAGELSFLGLVHYYGHVSLAAWGTGTGAAGIVGAGLYVFLTDWCGLGVQNSLFVSAFLPVIMFVSFFFVLPRGPLREGARGGGAKTSRRDYDPVPGRDLEQEAEDDGEDEDEDEDGSGIPTNATGSLLAGTDEESAKGSHIGRDRRGGDFNQLSQVKALFLPYMLPLFLVYAAEYAINQGVAPTLLFPLSSSPFSHLREFYPMYGFLYQLGVFVSRTSVAFVRIRHLYAPTVLQVANFALLALHAMYHFLPSVWVVFLVVFWEGLLGGAVYVNTFAEINESLSGPRREFSLSATSVADSAGICAAGFIGMALEPRLCDWQARHGRGWCKKIGIS